ncbi:MAG: phosphoenolpyruvate--protein phosphotransferase [bacterium]|nr:phosphoenolpyruvate--protein phosphotransferase [bacterium]
MTQRRGDLNQGTLKKTGLEKENLNVGEALSEQAPSIFVEGISLSSGLAMAPAFLYKGAPSKVANKNQAFQGIEQETHRLDLALQSLKREIKALKDQSQDETAGELLGSTLTLIEDEGWQGRLKTEIAFQKFTAEQAIESVLKKLRARANTQQDPYLKGHVDEISNLSGRLSSFLKEQNVVPQPKIPSSLFIAIAPFMAISELLELSQSGNLKGIILGQGGATSHFSIMARSLKIPVLSQGTDFLAHVQDGDLVCLDSEVGKVILCPSLDLQKDFQGRIAQKGSHKASYSSNRDLPVVTKDGVPISLKINAGLPHDLEALNNVGAEGVGLFRTEVSFMIHDKWPGVDRQEVLYRSILQKAAGAPVVFRTLDIGADKPLPYLKSLGRETPMGLRAVRMGLDRPALLRQQVRALIRAAEDQELFIMVPMVSEVAEFKAVRHLLDMEVSRAKERSQTLPSKISMGVMMEVPALAWQMPALLMYADFVSIGSNDLFQFFFASERTKSGGADRYDVLSPAFLSSLKYQIYKCNQANVPVSVCGEMAGQPLEALALLGLGCRSLSMNAASIESMRPLVRTTDLSLLQEKMEEMLPSLKRSLRQDLTQFAEEQGIIV